MIFLVSAAGLLLEVAYTRIISYKLWYYYTYLVIGLALLGIGSGGIFLATFARLRKASTETILRWSCLSAAVTVPLGYFIIARLPIQTSAIWNYGDGSSYKALAKLSLICFVLFASFISVGLVVSTILGRETENVGKLYFGDLVGAGLGCLIAIPLIVSLGPPGVVMVSAAIFAIAAIVSTAQFKDVSSYISMAVLVVLIGTVIGNRSLPDIEPEQGKSPATHAVYSSWGPVFRVDVHKISDENYLLAHDATFGSGIWRYDGHPERLTRFDVDVRRLPFDLLGTPPKHTLIVGSAGGNEILAALHFKSPRIEGVELNPVTVDIVKHRFANFTGHLDQQKGVAIHQGDARTYMARSTAKYNLVWVVAPDSYAANNAASSGAFVLSESYLYTSEMIARTLAHLTDDGISVAQFGEFSFKDRPNRTARYIMTARAALQSLGVKDPNRHIIVVDETGTAGSLPTIMVKRTPFTDAEVQRLVTAMPKGPVVTHPPNRDPISEDWRLIYAPGVTPADHLTARLAGATPSTIQSVVDSYPFRIDAVHDDKPFFWHFAGFNKVIREIGTTLKDLPDPENAIGERVLLLLLLISIVYAMIFLLLPFLFVRKTWAKLPKKATSAVYFGALGLGFILYEITMIQRLTRLLGYPSYSLTVTLAALLLSTAGGALLSNRLAPRASAWMPRAFLALCALTVVYEFGLDGITDHALDKSLPIRIVIALAVLTPLGGCLGLFMPLGLSQVKRLAAGEEYSAWAWAVNGFLSVVGSVLTTILAMEFGFRSVQWLALVLYAIAVVAFLGMHRAANRMSAS